MQKGVACCVPRLFIKSSTAWTRTRNQPVNSRSLCQLSYGGLTLCILRFWGVPVKFRNAFLHAHA